MNRHTTSSAFAALAIALAPLAAWSDAALAQAYPSKPVRLIVPFPAGGPSDQAARTIGQALSQPLGQAFVIENRPGADGAIATQAVLGAAPDGHTLLFSGSSMLPLSLLKNPRPFDPLTDFAPVSRVTRLEWAIYVSPQAPGPSLRELIAHARSNPERLSYASNNLAESLAAALFMKATGTSMVKVPYKGAPQSFPDLMAGRVQVNFAPLATGLAYVRDGRLRMLAVLQPQRSPFAPDVPTIAETGVPDISVPGWQAMFAPGKTASGIINRLNREIARALQAPEVRTQFERQAAQAEASTVQALAALIEHDLRIWRRFILESGIAPQ